MNGLHELINGSIVLNGESIKPLTFSQIAKIIGYIPQKHVLTFPFSVLDIVLMGRSPYINLTEFPNGSGIKNS